MKTKLILPLVSVIIFTGSIFAQDKSKALNEKNITWLGVDFSQARFTLVTEDPATIVNQYLPAINTLILAEPDKYKLKEFFGKTEVTPDLAVVTERNSKIDPAALVISEGYEIPKDDVGKIIKSYNISGKTGTGLVFIAGNLNKTSQTGSYYVVFFDMASKEIIDSRPMVGKAAGFGFRNYWAGSIYNVMKTWKK